MAAVTYRMDLGDFLRDVKASVDIEWDEDGGGVDWHILLTEKSREPGFSALVDDIIDNGIQDPIELYKNYRGLLELGNGHHRFAAAFLLAHDDILVTNSASFNRNDSICTYDEHWENTDTEAESIWISDQVTRV